MGLYQGYVKLEVQPEGQGFGKYGVEVSEPEPPSQMFEVTLHCLRSALRFPRHCVVLHWQNHDHSYGNAVLAEWHKKGDVVSEGQARTLRYKTFQVLESG